jgi:hypothetical protein
VFFALSTAKSVVPLKIAFAYDFAKVVFAIPFKVLFRAVPEAECFFNLFVAPYGVPTVLYSVLN